MSVKLGAKVLFPYLGDYRPVNIYKGENKIAGWKWAEQSGEELYFENTYNDFLDVEIDGKSYQDGAPTPDYPIESHSVNDFDVVSSVGRRNLLPTTYNLFTHDGGIYGFYKFLDEPEQVIVTVRDRDTSVNMRSIYFGLTDIGHNFGYGTWLMANRYLQIRERLSNHQNYFSYYPNNEATLNKIFQRFYIQIEKGTIATDWTPAPEDITENDNHSLIDKINLSLSEPLRSVGDVKDKVFRDSDGLWKVERKVELIYPEDGTRTIEETYGVLDNPIYEVLPQDYQDKLNNLRSFRDSNYVYTVVENLKPTLHARLKVKDI